MIISSPILRDKQCDPVVAHCDICGAEQYREDYMYIFEWHRICGECMAEKFDCLTTREKADLLGANCVKAGE